MATAKTCTKPVPGKERVKLVRSLLRVAWDGLEEPFFQLCCCVSATRELEEPFFQLCQFFVSGGKYVLVLLTYLEYKSCGVALC